MHFSLLAAVALAACALASPAPQGVTSAISPKASAPADCSPSYDSSFQIQVVNASTASTKKRMSKRQDGNLSIKLSGGVLTDQNNRTGYIASNFQFQFDEPPQAGAIYTSGFSACSNGTLALGDSVIWYACKSGDFYNIYDRSWAAQCSPVYVDILGGGSSASQSSDGQVGVTTAASASASGSSGAGEKSEGQPTASSVANSTAGATPIASSIASASASAGASRTGSSATGAATASATSSQTQAPEFSGAAAPRQIGEKLVAAAAGIAGAVALL